MRMLMDGSYTIAGVKYSQVKGANLKEKVEGLLTLAGTKEFLVKACGGLGFCHTHDEIGSIICVPPGHIVFISGQFEKDGAGATSIRWGFLSPDTTQAEVMAIKAVNMEALALYPGLAELKYPDWVECLQSHILPLA